MTHFKLHANCIPVKGAEKSIIVDLQNFSFYEVPNLLFEILQHTKDKEVDEIKEFYKHEYDEGIDAYFQKFIDLKLGFHLDSADELNEFPSLVLDWKTPYYVQAAVFEIDSNDRYDYLKVLRELIDLQLPSVLFHFVNHCKAIDIVDITSALDQSIIKTCDLFVSFEYLEEEMMDELLKNHERIRRLVLINTPKDLDQDGFYQKYPLKDKIQLTSKNIDPNVYADNISIENFKFLQTYFAEAQTYNVALNKKISFDKKGNIKNFLSHNQIFGNIHIDDWQKIYQSSVFQEKWLVSNDQIIKCRDCQFRYGCFSNSDLAKNDNEEWEKLQLCSFDPYSSSWNER